MCVHWRGCISSINDTSMTSDAAADARQLPCGLRAGVLLYIKPRVIQVIHEATSQRLPPNSPKIDLAKFEASL